MSSSLVRCKFVHVARLAICADVAVRERRGSRKVGEMENSRRLEGDLTYKRIILF